MCSARQMSCLRHDRHALGICFRPLLVPPAEGRLQFSPCTCRQGGAGDGIGDILGSATSGGGKSSVGSLTRGGSMRRPSPQKPALRRGGSVPTSKASSRVSFGASLQDDDRGKPTLPAAPPGPEASVATRSAIGGGAGGADAGDTVAAAATLDRLQRAAEGGNSVSGAPAVEDAAAPPPAGMASAFDGSEMATSDGLGSGRNRGRQGSGNSLQGGSPLAGASTGGYSSAADAVNQLESQLSAVGLQFTAVLRLLLSAPVSLPPARGPCSPDVSAKAA